jgi:Divergent InlB B-repeat domain
MSAMRELHKLGVLPRAPRVLMMSAYIALLMWAMMFAHAVSAAELRVMKTGLGDGTVTSSVAGINCGADCNEIYGAAAIVTLTAAPAADSTFVGWRGDCAVSPCTLTMALARSVRAEFALSTAIPTLTNFTPEGIQAFLIANPQVTTPAHFIKALPAEFRQNWILMSRSESLQTGIADMPRILLPSADARFVFTVGLATHSAYPGAHPNAIEYMQWDAVEKNFRFHEVVLQNVDLSTPPLTPPRNLPPGLMTRLRGVNIDDEKCTRCHSTRNVLNKSSFPGTTGVPIGLVKAKNKPNWDTYDSWAGMLPFNRDRIYKGSVEAAAFRKIFNMWNWRSNPAVRSVLEQLDLQPPPPGAGTPTITRVNGGANDGHVQFAFDGGAIVTTEPLPTGSGSINTAYSFDGVTGVGAVSPVVQGGDFITLQHSGNATPAPVSGDIEGRGVQLFDLLSGSDGVKPNQQRVADEIINHRFATGSVPIDVRPIALAITKGCFNIDAAMNRVVAPAGTLTIDLNFFNARNGMSINALYADTGTRAKSLPRRKADLQRLNLVRDIDAYLDNSLGADAAPGLIAQYGAATALGLGGTLERVRQEIFRRNGGNDQTVMGGIYVDRENHDITTTMPPILRNTTPLALFRYFLEPLGVSVDKWSTGVRGRSRTYTFADLFGSYMSMFETEIQNSLLSAPIAGLSSPFDCGQLITAVNTTLGSLPASTQVPTFTDVQRIFNKGCIECHGGLNYPPYSNYSSFPAAHIDFSEDENPPSGMFPAGMSPRLARSHAQALGLTSTTAAGSYLYQRITQSGEDCPNGLMPCGGPALSKTDVETIRRWIEGPPSRPHTVGDPHLRTVDGIDYDFQSAGEFTLLRNEYLEIQTRQTPVSTSTPLPPDGYTGLSSCASVNTAVAVRLGPHRITYQPNPDGKPSPEGLELRVDGKLIYFQGNEFLLPSGGRIVRTAAQGGIQIEGLGGAVITITPGWWDHYQIWYLNIDTRNTRAIEGVAGARAYGSWLPALPDGGSFGAKPASLSTRYKHLYLKFADAWRVDDKTSLFDYAAGLSTKYYTVPEWPEASPKICNAPLLPGGPIKREPLKPIVKDQAVKVCSGIRDKTNFANCVQDVAVTGEIGFAKAYVEAEKIASNAPPVPFKLLEPNSNETLAGDIVNFNWYRSKDPDGDNVTYRHCMWLAGETPTFGDCEIVKDAFDKDILSQRVGALKSGKVYFWKVLAEDGNSGTTESETRRFTVK